MRSSAKPNQSFIKLASHSRERTNSITAIAIRTISTILDDSAWSLIIARLTYPTTLFFYISNRLVWQAAGITRIRRHTCNCSTGASVAGRWRSTTRKERMKAWTSTNCGTSTLSKDTSRWLPLFIVYCEPANMIPTFANDFNANSRYRLKITQQHGVAFHKHNLCGV